MKKIILIGMVFFAFFCNGNLFAVPRMLEAWSCTTNGNVTHNPNPIQGQDHWTYNEVYTEVVVYGLVRFHNTYCLDKGEKNCRAASNSFSASYSENGTLIYDSDYAYDSVEMMSDFVEQQITNDVDNGSQSFNDIKNNFLIYRNITWETSQTTGEVIKSVSIAFDEVTN